MYSVKVDSGLCKGCGLCARVCLLGVLEMSRTVNARGFRDVVVKASSDCIGCLCCYLVCPDIAIEVAETGDSPGFVEGDEGMTKMKVSDMT